MGNKQQLTRRGLFGSLVPVSVAAIVLPSMTIPAHDEWVWRTAAGEDLRLPDIKDSHLLNIERMLRGDGRQLYEKENAAEAHVIIIQEIARRGLRTRQAVKPSYYEHVDVGDDDMWGVDQDGWPE